MTVRKIDISEATEPLSQYARQADEGPVVVTSGGEPIAIVLRVDNADLETVALSSHPKFLELIGKSRDRQTKEGGMSSEEMRRLFDAE